jgi:hypothetical protein
VQKDFCNNICQKATYAPQQTAPLFDHLVGARKAARWAGRGQRFGSPEIYNSFEFGGLLARKITGLFPLENAIEPAGPLQWRS